MHALNRLERTFINRFQGGFPLIEQPFAAVAECLDTDESTLILTIDGLLQKGLLSRFGPLFDAERLGGAVTLAALEVPQHRYAQVTEQVNSLTSVAHNYRRDHRLNMWFVVTSEQVEGVATTLVEIERLTGLRVYNFPRQQAFYLGLWLHLDENGQIDTRSKGSDLRGQTRLIVDYDQSCLTPLISATQAGLPLCRDPWGALAGRLGIRAPEVLARLQGMLASGVIRRVGAVPNHYRLGLRGNGMSVWDVPDERAEELGRAIGALDCVSHCYLRPRHAGIWPYNLFAMLHGADRQVVEVKARRIAHLLGRQCRGHDILFSSAVLKKTGLRLAA
jgi:DNA-binding Lrp family transcriptional regulator